MQPTRLEVGDVQRVDLRFVILFRSVEGVPTFWEECTIAPPASLAPEQAEALGREAVENYVATQSTWRHIQNTHEIICLGEIEKTPLVLEA